MAIGKTAPNGTLNADGAFYSVQDVNVLLENAGGGGGGDLPTPTVADAGKAVVVDEEGKFSLMNNLFYVGVVEDDDSTYLSKNYKEIMEAITGGALVVIRDIDNNRADFQYVNSLSYTNFGNPVYRVRGFSPFWDGVVETLNVSIYQSDSETGQLTLVAED